MTKYCHNRLRSLMKKSLLIIVALMLLFSASCAKEKEKPKALPLPVLKVAVDPIKVHLLEQENLNIPYWTMNGARDRTLVHISSVDGLVSLDERTLKSLKEAVDKGYAANLVSNWIPAIEGLREKLRAGARVADVAPHVLALAMLRYDQFWIANALYLSFALGTFVASVAKIVTYRRGF